MDKSFVELYRQMRKEGIEHTIPATERKVLIRTIEAKELLKDGKMPDILTPLIVKAVYQELDDKTIQDSISITTDDIQDALKVAEMIDFVVERSLKDDTQVDDLTTGEKRWIFRLAMGPAELLISFCQDQDADVEFMAEVQKLQPVA